MNKRCATCEWATFDMTNHNPPRPRPKRAGRCEFDITGRTNEFFSGLPECVTYSFPAVRQHLEPRQPGQTTVKHVRAGS